MTKRENRRFLQRQIVELERLKPFTTGHPLMEPLRTQREEAFRAELAQNPAGGSEARTVLFFTGKPVHGSQGIDAQLPRKFSPLFWKWSRPSIPQRSTVVSAN